MKEYWCILNLGMIDDQMKFILDEHKVTNIDNVLSVISLIFFKFVLNLLHSHNLCVSTSICVWT